MLLIQYHFRLKVKPNRNANQVHLGSFTNQPRPDGINVVFTCHFDGINVFLQH